MNFVVRVGIRENCNPRIVGVVLWGKLYSDGLVEVLQEDYNDS